MSEQTTGKTKHMSQIALWKHLKEQNKAGKTDIVYIDPKELVIEEGFNIRPIDWGYVAQLTKSYNDGDNIPPIVVEIIERDGRPVPIVRDGHHRTHAAVSAKMPQVAISPFKGNAEAAVVLMLKSGSTRPLTRLQFAVGVKRLRACHLSQQKIADMLGISQGEVSNLEKISMLPEAVKEMIEKNQISATTAVDLHVTHGDGLYDFLQARLAEKAPVAGSAEEAAPQQDDLLEDGQAPAAKKKVRAELTSRDLKPKLPKLQKKTLVSMEDTLLNLGSRLDVASISELPEDGFFELKISRTEALVIGQLHAELEELRAMKAQFEAQNKADVQAVEKQAEEQINLLH